MNMSIFFGLLLEKERKIKQQQEKKMSVNVPNIITMPPDLGIGHDTNPSQPDGKRGINSRPVTKSKEIPSGIVREKPQQRTVKRRFVFFDRIRETGPLAAFFIIFAMILVRNR